MLALMLARVSVEQGDLVRYMPKYADPYRKELAVVEEVLDASKDPLEAWSLATPYWLKVRFKKDRVVKTLNAQAFVVEEVRQTVPRAY